VNSTPRHKLGSLLRPVGSSATSYAIVDETFGPCTYGALEAATQAVYDRLAGGPGSPGHLVGILLPPGAPFVSSLIATMSVGAALPLRYGDTSEEQHLFVERAGLTAVICDEVSADSSLARAASCPLLATGDDLGTVTYRTGRGRIPAARRIKQGSLLIPTSGTTGDSKLALHTTSTLMAAARLVADAFALGPADRCLTPMPLYHTHGLVGCVLATLMSGGSTILTDFHTREIDDVLHEYQPTWFSASPPLLHLLLGASRAVEQYKGFRLIRSASASLSRELIRQLESRCDARVANTYALTEAPGVVTRTPPPPAPPKLDTVGVAVGCDLRIIGADGAALPPGATGEVIIRGPHVFDGYVTLSTPADLQRGSLLAGGWLRTGDLGVLDDDGYLALVGRLKEIINVGGENVVPDDVERALVAYPGVAEAACFPVPDAVLGEIVAAAVVSATEGDVDLHDLRKELRKRLPPAKVPQRIWERRSLPKTETGKVLRLRLAAEILGEEIVSG
jgi:acyl-CoA synthetase (AMP-forming)/AMP-acid ligase II